MSRNYLHPKYHELWFALMFAGVCLALIIGGVFFVHESNRRAEAKAAQVKKAKEDMANIVISEEAFTAYSEDPFPDPWGNKYVARKIAGTREGYEIASSGPDGVPGTPDDLTERITKINWKNAGKGVGQGVGQFGRGLWKGLTEDEEEKK